MNEHQMNKPSIRDKLQQQREEVAQRRAAMHDIAHQQKEGAKVARDTLAQQRDAARNAERVAREEKKKLQEEQRAATKASAEAAKQLREEAAAERKARRAEESEKLRTLLRKQQAAREAEMALLGDAPSEEVVAAPVSHNKPTGGDVDELDIHLQMALDAAQNALLQDDLDDELWEDAHGDMAGAADGDDGDDVSSVNSRDLADENFMQEFQEVLLAPRIAELQEEVAVLKKEAVRLMKEVGDKAGALDSLKKAKLLEQELANLQK